MENLSNWRQDWRKAKEVEKSLWRPRPVAEKVGRYLELRRTFAERLEQTRVHSREERMNYLADLQMRLKRISEFRSGPSQAQDIS